MLDRPNETRSPPPARIALTACSELRSHPASLEAVGKPVRYVKLAAVAFRKFNIIVFQIRRRTGTNIDNHVMNGASRASYELDLPMRRLLEVHAADRARFCVERSAALQVMRLQSPFVEGVDAKRAREIAAFVPYGIKLYQIKPGQSPYR